MAKGDISNVQKQVQGQLGTTAQQYNQYQSGLQPEIQQAQKQASDLYPGVVSGFNQMSLTGGYDPGNLANLRSTGYSLGSTGGYDPGNLTNIQNQFSSLAQGLDPSIIGNLRGTAGTFANTGAYDPSSYNELAGGYENLISTGGISDADAARRQTTASRASKSVYDTLATQAGRNAAITGGTAGPDLSKLARQSGNTASAAATDALAGIDTARQQGRIAGLSGYSGLQGAQAANRLAGLGYGLTGSQQELQNQQNQLAATGGAANLAGNVASGARDIYGKQLGLESDVASGSRAGTQGLSNLFNSITGQGTALQGLGLGALGQQNTAQNQQLQQLADLAKSKPGLFQSIMGGLGAAGDIFGSVFSPIKLGGGGQG